MRRPTIALLTLTGGAVLVAAACSLEVNVNTHGHDDEAPPAATSAPDAPTPPVVDPPPPPRATAPTRPSIPIPPPPPRTFGPDDGAVRDALLRYREPPAPRSAEELAEEPTFTPFTVAPSLLNRPEVVDALQREYPPLLRDAGIGGTVRIYFFIDADGTVRERRIDQGSGHQALDDAAMRVAAVYRFSPALNRDEKVPVWVSFPVTFQVAR